MFIGTFCSSLKEKYLFFLGMYLAPSGPWHVGVRINPATNRYFLLIEYQAPDDMCKVEHQLQHHQDHHHPGQHRSQNLQNTPQFGRLNCNK